MINEETFPRQIVKVKPHQQDMEESSNSIIDEVTSCQELLARRQSLPSDGCQPYDIFMKVKVVMDSSRPESDVGLKRVYFATGDAVGRFRSWKDLPVDEVPGRILPGWQFYFYRRSRFPGEGFVFWCGAIGNEIAIFLFCAERV